MERGYLKELARRQLKRRYWPALLVCMVVIFFSSATQGIGRIPFSLIGFITRILSFQSELHLLVATLIFAIIIQIFISGPIIVGNSRFFINEAEANGQIKDVFFAFRTKFFWKITSTMFIYTLIILVAIVLPLMINLFFIRGGHRLPLLLFVPLLLVGILWSYRFRFVPYFVAQYPYLSSRRSLRISKNLTEYKAFKLLRLDLSFMGWYIIGALLFGLGIFLVRPYHAATVAYAYRNEIDNYTFLTSELEEEDKGFKGKIVDWWTLGSMIDENHSTESVEVEDTNIDKVEVTSINKQEVANRDKVEVANRDKEEVAEKDKEGEISTAEIEAQEPEGGVNS